MGIPSHASPLRNCGRSSKKFNDSHSSYRHIPRKVQTNVRFNSHKNPQSSLFIAAQSRGPCSQELVNKATRIHLCATSYRSSGVALMCTYGTWTPGLTQIHQTQQAIDCMAPSAQPLEERGQQWPQLGRGRGWTESGPLFLWQGWRKFIIR